MNLKRYLSIAACVLLCFLSAVTSAGFMPISKAFATGPEMNKPFSPTDFKFEAWGNKEISKEYFLENAVEIRVKVVGSAYVAFQVKDSDYKEYKWNDSNASGVTYTLDDKAREAAFAGTLKVRVNENNSTLTIINLDAQGLEDENSGTGSSDTYPQLTDVPTVYINFPMEDGKKIEDYLYKNRATNYAPYVTAKIRVIDNSDPSSPQHLEPFVDDVQIKVRGNSTADIIKKPYRLKFAKDEKDAEGNVLVQHKHDLLGHGYKKRNWTMLALALDPSLMRNALTYHIGKYVGMPFCPGYKFVDLVINGDYRGTYQISDHCEVGSNRVEVDEETGWFVEASRFDMAEDPKLVTQAGLWMSIKNPESEDAAVISQLKSDIKKYFDAFESQLKNPDPITGWRAYVDEESLVNYYIGVNIAGDYDGFMQLKMYRNAQNDKLHFGPLWDKDLAFGNFGADDGKTLMQDYNNGQFYNNLKDLWNDALFVKHVHDRYHELLQNGLANNLASNITKIKALVAQTQVENQKKMGGLSSWVLSFSNYNDAVSQLDKYVSDHIDFLTKAIDQRYDQVKNQLPPDTPEPVHAQLTNLPTIYLSATVGDEWSTASVEVFDRDNKLNQGTETWTNNAVQAQYQGSGDKNKDSYRLKFDEKIKLFASGKKYKQWVLLANDDDPSMINNALAKELGDALGLPFTPGYQFVDLYVNETYMGTYQLTDRIKVEEGRAQVIDAANKDNKNSKDLDWHVRFNDAGEYNEDKPTYYIAGNETMPYIIPKNPDPKDDPTNWESTLKAQMTSYFNGIFSTDQEGNYTAFAEGIDQQQLIQWYIAQEVLSVYKGFSSIEAYRSVTAEDQKLHIGVLWDSEKAFGNTGEAPAIDMSDQDAFDTYKGLMISYAANDAMKKLFINLWQQEWFAEGVKKMWDDKRTSLDELTNKATEISSTLNASQSKNLEKWGKEASLGNFQSYDAAVGAVTSYLDTRFEYLDSKFSQLAIIASIDVPTMIDYILGIKTEGWEKHDLNNDTFVTIEDLVILINAKNLK